MELPALQSLPVKHVGQKQVQLNILYTRSECSLILYLFLFKKSYCQEFEYPLMMNILNSGDRYNSKVTQPLEHIIA